MVDKMKSKVKLDEKLMTCFNHENELSGSKTIIKK